MVIIAKTILISLVGTALLIQGVKAAELQEAPKVTYTRVSLDSDPRIGDEALDLVIEHVMPSQSYDSDRIMCKYQFLFNGVSYELTAKATKPLVVRSALLANSDPYLLGALCSSYVGRNEVGVSRRLALAIDERIDAEKKLREASIASP